MKKNLFRAAIAAAAAFITGTAQPATSADDLSKFVKLDPETTTTIKTIISEEKPVGEGDCTKVIKPAPKPVAGAKPAVKKPVAKKPVDPNAPKRKYKYEWACKQTSGGIGGGGGPAMSYVPGYTPATSFLALAQPDAPVDLGTPGGTGGPPKQFAPIPAFEPPPLVNWPKDCEPGGLDLNTCHPRVPEPSRTVVPLPQPPIVIGGGWCHECCVTPLPAVPEPSTYALMAAGAAVVGFAARRRQKSTTKGPSV